MVKVVLAVLVLSCVIPLVVHGEISRKNTGGRWRRQAAIGVLNPPIPTSVGHYLGADQLIDSCPRDEVKMAGGACHPLLKQGPCLPTEFVLLNQKTNEGYCAPRLCAPDRIFIFSDQLCHDPRSLTLCPPGRQLYHTAYGTPVCQCPDGTYEGDDDLDDDVCEPILGQTLTCPAGQVLWFRDFSLPPECLPDPCGGENLNRGPNDLPFVPSADGKCFQLGQMSGVCPAPTWYSLALDRLQGVCSTLEDAGYQVFDPETLAIINEIYGPPIPRETTAPIPVPGSPGTLRSEGVVSEVSSPGGVSPGVSGPGVSPGVSGPGGVSPGVSGPGGVSPGASVPGGVSPGASVPGGVSPGASVPGGVSPGASVPGGVSPGASVPGASVSGGVSPGVSVPGGVSPDVSVPGSASPGVSVPGGVSPGVSVPGSVSSGVSGPGSVGSGVSGPVSVNPGVSGPVSVSSGVSVPGGVSPGVSVPGGVSPGVSVPGGVSPGASVPGSVSSGVSGPVSVSSGVSVPGGVSPGVFVPGVSPGVSVPGGVSPGVSVPGVSPGVSVPGVSPGVSVPGVSPGVSVPGGVSPGVSVPGVSPGVSVPGVSPGVSVPGGVSPDVSVPGSVSSGVSIPVSVSSGVSVPGGVSPGVSVPGGVSPGVSVPGDVSHGVSVPGGVSPGVSVPGGVSPGVSVPVSVSPGVSVPVSVSPGVSVPVSVSPGVSVPGGVGPGVSISGSASPGVSVPGSVSSGVSVPGSVVPGISVPVGVSSGVSVPVSVSPGVSVPGVSISGSASPGVSVPGSASLGVSVPGSVSSGVSVPGSVVPAISVPVGVSPGVSVPVGVSSGVSVPASVDSGVSDVTSLGPKVSSNARGDPGVSGSISAGPGIARPAGRPAVRPGIYSTVSSSTGIPRPSGWTTSSAGLQPLSGIQGQSRPSSVSGGQGSSPLSTVSGGQGRLNAVNGHGTQGLSGAQSSVNHYLGGPSLSNASLGHRPGYSTRPHNPLVSSYSGTDISPPHGSQLYGPPSMYSNERHSTESDEVSSGRAYGSTGHPIIDVVKGHLIAKKTNIMDSISGAVDNLDFLNIPLGQKLQGFMKGVKAIMSDLVSGRSHHRSRRAPLPHATPGNVIETRLVGCRAGAQRDINAKCRDTILPAQPLVNRATRAAPPVPPQPGCPGGQSYDLQRMCTSSSSAINSINAAGGRWRRQAAIGRLNPPIPTSLSYYPEQFGDPLSPTTSSYTQVSDEQIDLCDREEVRMPDGRCHNLLTQGPCEVTEVVLLDRETNQGYCAPRLCAPDRIFVFSDQLCHDPRSNNLCPPGRQLYQSAFGTPVCQCPDGTYETSDKVEEDVCEPLLGQSRFCPPGQVLWFRDFNLPPECLPDPCGGVNLNRGPNDLPFVPSADGRCFQLGQMSGVCPAQTWYSLALDRLQGVCSTLEDAGYEIFDPEALAILIHIYGPPIPRETTPPIPVPVPDVYSEPENVGSRPYGPSYGYGNALYSKKAMGSSVGPSYGTSSQSLTNTNVVKMNLIARLKGIMESMYGADQSLDLLQAPRGTKLHEIFKNCRVKAIMSDLVSGRSHHRSRRAPLPHATPGNVIETRLVGCRAGAQRDINAKCRDTILPARPPFDRVTRAAPPVPPQPGCPGGGAYTLQRTCSSPNNAINSINAFNLG
nr:uncharacterized protein LOC123754540 [Procambarus clarkii]